MAIMDLMVSRIDLIPDNEGAGQFLPLVIAVMVFFSALVGVFGIALYGVTDSWRENIGNTLTIEVPFREAKTENPVNYAQRDIEVIVKTLRETRGILEVRPMSESELSKLLAPWLGDSSLIKNLPIPRLIDVQYSSAQPPDLPELAKRLSEIGPDIFIDDHQLWVGQLMRLSLSLQLMIVACIIIVFFITCTMVVFSTRAAFVAHLEVISFLHVIGASEGYIVFLFLKRAILMGLGGSVIGILIMLSVLFACSNLVEGLEGPLLRNISLSPLGITFLVILPFLVTVLTSICARRTVVRELAKIP